MVVYNLLEAMVGFVDLMMVHPLGPSATAAIGVSRQVTFLIEAAAVAISTGVITLVSQSVGARKPERVYEIIRHAAGLVVLFAVPTTLLGYLISRPLLVGMNASENTLASADSYLRVYFLGVVFLWGNIVGTAVFRGSGDVWTPLKIAVGVNLLNVLLNYVFIYGVGPFEAWGVPGAAMGTVAARTCGAVLCLAILWNGPLSMRTSSRIDNPNLVPWWQLDTSLVRRILRIGLPIALAGLLRNGARLVFLGIVGAGAFSVSFHAAVGVGLQLRLFSLLPALAFQSAGATLVGQAIGRGDVRDAEMLGRRYLVLLALIMVLVSGTLFALAEPLAVLLIPGRETADLGVRVLKWFAVAQFFSALSIAMQGALTGAGDTAPAVRYMLVSQWFVMLPLSYFLFISLGLVPDGPLIAWTIAPVISLILTWRRFQSGHWKTIRA